MAVEPVEFFVDIELLCDQGELDLKARRIRLDVELVEPLALFRADLVEHLRHALANRCRDGLDIRAAGLEHVPNALALAGPHRVHRFERGVEEATGLGEQRLRVELGFAHDAGPAEHVDGIGELRVVQCSLYFCDALADQGDQLHVNLHVRLRIDGAAQVQGTFDLATFDDGANLLFERMLARTKLVRQTKLHVEVAMVDRTKFAGQRAGRGFGRLSREPCHTV